MDIIGFHYESNAAKETKRPTQDIHKMITRLQEGTKGAVDAITNSRNGRQHAVAFHRGWKCAGS